MREIELRTCDLRDYCDTRPCRKDSSLHTVPGMKEPLAGQSQKQLGKAIKAALRSRDLTQKDLSDLTGFDTSKISRIIREEISADANTVDAIPIAFQDESTKFEIIKAYINEVTSAEMRRNFTLNPRIPLSRGQLDISDLSPIGASLITYVVEKISAKRELESVLIEFAKLMGWPGTSEENSSNS